MPWFLPDLNRKKLPLLDRKTLFKLYQTSSIFLGIAPLKRISISSISDSNLT